ncbi:MAG: DUF3987 domain-containing protein, partial [Methyloprofundus sp.]|nr:DUF3987 domain-containing protein [Methyloprofundus sp.]
SRALVQHQYQKPTKPKRFKLNYGNSTYESIIDGISSDYPFISIASAEGGSELNSRIFKNLAILNSLWSNEPFTVSRKSSGSIEISDAGLSLTIMTQPTVLEKFSQKNSSDVIGSGYLARLMPCRALSGRLSHTISRSEAANLFDYEQRMQEILDQSVTAFHEENARKVMRLSPEAKLYCQNLEQEIRAGMAPNGRFDGAIEHASKLLDNTIRIAANIHYFCYNDSEISGISMQMAAGIAAYFSDEYRAMFVRPPAYIQNAMLLNDWLNQFRAGQTFIRKNFILQNGPNTLRKSSLVTEALSVLTQHGQVRVFQEGRTIWVNINPQMYSDVLPSELMEKPKNNSLNNQILGDKP